MLFLIRSPAGSGHRRKVPPRSVKREDDRCSVIGPILSSPNVDLNRDSEANLENCVSRQVILCHRLYIALQEYLHTKPLGCRHRLRGGTHGDPRAYLESRV